MKGISPVCHRSELQIIGLKIYCPSMFLKVGIYFQVEKHIDRSTSISSKYDTECSCLMFNIDLAKISVLEGV